MVAGEENNPLACPMQSREPREVSEDAVRKVGQHCVGESDGKPICILAKWHNVVRRYRFPPMVKSFSNSDTVNWMCHGRGFLIAAVGFGALAAATSVIALALLFVFSTLSAALASFSVAFSTVCFMVAFFLSSVTVVYVGALGLGGLTIGSIAFFSVWAVIIFLGWVAIAWVIWQGLRKAFQFGKHLAILSGSILLSFPAAQKLKPFGVKIKECLYFPFMSKTMAMD